MGALSLGGANPTLPPTTHRVWADPLDVIALLKQDNVWSSLPNDLQRFLWALFYEFLPSISNHDPQLIRGI